jgi:ATP-binding cassette subfamily B protein
MVRSMQENISGVRVIKALSKGALESKKFEGVNDELTRREFKANKIMSLTNPLATLILNMGLVVVLVVGAYLSTPAGTVLAFLSYFTIILNAMLGISKIFVMLSRGVASANRIEEVLNLNENMPSLPHTMGDTGYAVQFKDVNFSYTGHGDVLSGINFEIKDGQTLGIIGPTGSGKSTIINLLMRFYDVDSGSVFVDGEDVRSMNVEELRKKFGVAFQNDFLMAADISKNIDYGRGLSPNDIDSAIICAQADEFVSHLEGGKNYMLAQKAANLSGGQKQRLIVARALAGKPHIIVLDDSSSALDYATDASLRKVLATEYASSTKIIIAQRISSVKNADLILVIEDGKIIGKGTHDYLLNTCSQYAEIYAVQMGCTA